MCMLWLDAHVESRFGKFAAFLFGFSEIMEADLGILSHRFWVAPTNMARIS